MSPVVIKVNEEVWEIHKMCNVQKVSGVVLKGMVALMAPIKRIAGSICRLIVTLRGRMKMTGEARIQMKMWDSNQNKGLGDTGHEESRE